MDWSKRRNRSLRICLAAALCLALCVTAGCKKEEPEIPVEEGFCAEISVFDCLQGLGFCDKGMTRVEEDLIMFYEYETGRSYPLCSDAYCEHIPYNSRSNPDPVCEATLEELKMACVHGDYVYTIQRTGVQEITVRARNLMESGYRTVATLPYCQTFSPEGYNAIIGDKAYLLLAEIDNLQEDELLLSYTSNDLYTYLVELDLKTGEYRTLFHIEGEEKYKVLQTVYGDEGVYCRSYYEDTENNEDFTQYKINEYREMFSYAAYDGAEKELCPELVELTAYYGEGIFPNLASGISEYGAYLVNEDMTKVECYKYDGGKETVFELPEGYTKLLINAINGDKMIMELTTQEGTYKTAGFDLTSGELIIRDNTERTSYVAVCDEGFTKFCQDEQGGYRELWTYRDIFSKDGKPLLTIRY